MMKIIISIFALTGSICIFGTTQAQESQKASVVQTDETSDRAITPTAPSHEIPNMPVPSMNLPQYFEPKMEFWANQGDSEQYQTSVIIDHPKDNKAERRRIKEINRESRMWRSKIGNTSVTNWSPYPDRALDARVLSFPLQQKN